MTDRRSSTERGYGAAHRRLRAWWAPRVDRGEVACAGAVKSSSGPALYGT
jgi:hypothetical protein